MDSFGAGDLASTRHYGEAAWNSICAHGTSAHPDNYAVWYAFARKSHPGLTADLGRSLASGAPTDDELQDLHRKHLLAEVDGQTVDAIARQAQAELRSVLDALKVGSGELGASEADLRHVLGSLAKPDFSRSDLHGGLSAIVAVAGRMAEVNAVLAKRLQSSEQQIAALETDLGTARLQTLTDGLTRLSNRRAFDEHLAGLFGRPREEGGAPVLAMIDIDHFKAFNDRHGHPIGDQVIRFVASAIREVFPLPALSARYGGEEFAVVVTAHPEGECRRLLEELRSRIARYDLVQRGTNLQIGRVSISVGGTTRRPDDTASSLVARADEHLYDSKKSGRNRVTFAA